MNNRIRKIQEIIQRENLDGLLISTWENIYYLSGLVTLSPREREAWLFISREKAFLITDGRYIESAKKIQDFEIIELKAGERFSDIWPKLLEKTGAEMIGVEGEDLKFLEYQRLKLKKLENNLLASEGLVEELRRIKSAEELEKIERACQVADEVFGELLKIIKPGMTEQETALRLEVLMREKGAEGIAFESIVASGAGSAIPHYVTGMKKLQLGELVLFDFGAKYQGYLSDITRCLVLGKASDKQKKVYETVLASQEKALAGIRPGMTGAEVDKIAREEIERNGYPAYSHGLGHGVGLAIHEAPYLRVKNPEVLTEGMVFSVEPGIYLPGWGGVRIEDLVVLEKNGPRRLTKFTKKLLEISN